jgi:hypothetical protein
LTEKKLIGLATDEKTHRSDLIFLYKSRKNAREIAEIFEKTGCKREHSAVFFVEIAEIPRFLEENGRKMAPIAKSALKMAFAHEMARFS